VPELGCPGWGTAVPPAMLSSGNPDVIWSRDRYLKLPERGLDHCLGGDI